MTEAVLVELRLDEREREPRRDDERHLHLAHEVREGADVVFVAVREDDGTHHLLPLAQIGEVRQDEVDTEMLVAREREAGIDDDDRAVRFVDGHVLSDLAEAAERDDPADAHSAAVYEGRVSAGATAGTPSGQTGSAACGRAPADRPAAAGIRQDAPRGRRGRT